MNEKPLVSILCATFNQKDYIAQTIEGFLLQKVNFPLEIIINDDASTDGTTDIVRDYAERYPDLIKPIFHEQNQYSKDVEIWHAFLYPKAQGKYIAECEGDDYWTDPNKLQRQVDFLEAHPDYALSHTSFQFYNQADGTFKENSFAKDNLEIHKNQPERISALILDDNKYRIQTVTIVYRKKLLSQITDDFAVSSYFKMGDTQFYFFASQFAKIHFDPSVTSVYRLTPHSACHRGEKNIKAYRFNLSCQEMRVYLSKYLSEPELIQKFRKAFGKALIRYAIFDPSFRSKVDESVISPKQKFALFCARHFSLARAFFKRKWRLV